MTTQFPLDIHHDDTICEETDKNSILEIIDNLHLICLKLLQELMYSDKSAKIANKNDPTKKILNYGHILFIESCFSNYVKSNERNLNTVLFSESIDKLAQYLQLCFHKDALQFTKLDVKNLFEKYVKLVKNDSFFILLM